MPDGSRRPADEALGDIQPPELILISGVVSPTSLLQRILNRFMAQPLLPPRPHNRRAPEPGLRRRGETATSLRGPLCAGEAFSLGPLGQGRLVVVRGCCAKKRGSCGFWYVRRGVILVLSVEGSGHHRRAFDTSTVKIPGRLLARSIAG